MLVVKNPLSNAGDAGDPSSISVLGRSPEENGNTLHYSCLENPMGRILWKATFIGLQRVGHNWSNWAWMHMHIWLQRFCFLSTRECTKLLAKYFTLIHEFSKILTCNSHFRLHSHYNLCNFFILIAKCFYKVILPSYWFQLMRSCYYYLLLIAHYH